MKAPTNEYESLRAGMEYKLAMQAIRKLIRTNKESDYAQVTEIAKIIQSVEEDVRKRCGNNDADT